MSFQIALIGIGAVYTIREHYLPIKEECKRDKEHIKVLEEEIVRLKREMRICGILRSETDRSPSSSVS